MNQSTILIVGHGSREEAANRAFKRLVRQYAACHPNRKIAYAFLELAQPSLETALESLSASASAIIVLPLFLFASGHMRRDIPLILKKFRQKHPSVNLSLVRELGPDPLMVELMRERSKKLKGKPSQTWVLVVGRGAREKKIQNDFKRLARGFGKERGFAKVEGCFFDLALPSLEDALEKAATERPSVLWIIPYLLFQGKLLVKIKEKAKDFSKNQPLIQTQVAKPLGFHPLLFKILDQRLKK